jgi:DNA-binding transcriptional ArsR family regulator
MTVMQQSPPGLLPLFRSQTQLAVLGLLFAGAARSWTVGELARQLGLGVPTVSKEVARLKEAGIVKIDVVGRSRLVSANWGIPWAEPLAELLDRTIGPLARLSEALDGFPGIVSVWIFGSWAKRYRGEVGSPPRDIDVMVVGDDLDLLSLPALADRVADEIALPVNTQTVTLKEWDGPDPGGFVDHIKRSALVEIPLQANA